MLSEILFHKIIGLGTLFYSIGYIGLIRDKSEKSQILDLQKDPQEGIVFMSPDLQGERLDSWFGRWFIGIQKTSPKLPHGVTKIPGNPPKIKCGISADVVLNRATVEFKMGRNVDF